MSVSTSRDDWARAEARTMSTVELRNAAEALYWQLDDQDATPNDRAFTNESVRPYLEAYTAELQRRERLQHAGRVNPYREHDEALGVLRDAIRDRIELADFLEQEGVPVIRGKLESHSACPVCLGSDRFVIRHAPNSRGWCRQCRTAGDVIAIAEAFWGTGFADTVVRLAGDFLGLSGEVAA